MTVAATSSVRRHSICISLPVVWASGVRLHELIPRRGARNSTRSKCKGISNSVTLCVERTDPTDMGA